MPDLVSSHATSTVEHMYVCDDEDEDVGEDLDPQLRAMIVGVAIQEQIAATGRCACGRKPSLLSRLLERLAR